MTNKTKEQKINELEKEIKDGKSVFFVLIIICGVLILMLLSKNNSINESYDNLKQSYEECLNKERPVRYLEKIDNIYYEVQIIPYEINNKIFYFKYGDKINEIDRVCDLEIQNEYKIILIKSIIESWRKSE